MAELNENYSIPESSGEDRPGDETGDEAEKEERTYKIRITAGNFEIDIKNPKNKNPFQLIEQLYNLRYDETLTKEEKNKKVQEIMQCYLR
jgi:hypothetical protein